LQKDLVVIVSPQKVQGHTPQLTLVKELEIYTWHTSTALERSPGC